MFLYAISVNINQEFSVHAFDSAAAVNVKSNGSVATAVPSTLRSRRGNEGQIKASVGSSELLLEGSEPLPFLFRQVDASLSFVNVKEEFSDRRVSNHSRNVVGNSGLKAQFQTLARAFMNVRRRVGGRHWGNDESSKKKPNHVCC